jgi:ribosomal protein L32
MALMYGCSPPSSSKRLDEAKKRIEEALSEETTYVCESCGRHVAKGMLCPWCTGRKKDELEDENDRLRRALRRALGMLRDAGKALGAEPAGLGELEDVLEREALGPGPTEGIRRGLKGNQKK